jgi:hypothetical protein
MDDLKLGTTTDSQETVDATVAGDEQGGRVAETKFDSENLDGSTSVSFEHEQSSRHLLEEQLALRAEEKDAAALTSGIRTESTERESQPRDGEGTEQEQDELAQIGISGDHPHRQRIADAHRWYGAEVLNVVASRLNGVNVAPGVAQTIAEFPNSTEMIIELARYPEPAKIAAALSSMSPPAARQFLQTVSQEIEDRSKAQPVATRSKQGSRAPMPINPIRGSATVVAPSLDQADYQTFKRERQKQINARYRR